MDVIFTFLNTQGRISRQIQCHDNNKTCRSGSLLYSVSIGSQLIIVLLFSGTSVKEGSLLVSVYQLFSVGTNTHTHQKSLKNYKPKHLTKILISKNLNFKSQFDSICSTLGGYSFTAKYHISAMWHGGQVKMFLKSRLFSYQPLACAYF